jgi:hypothetical protein
MILDDLFGSKMRSPDQIRKDYERALNNTIPAARLIVAIATSVAFFMIGYEWLSMMRSDLHPALYFASGLVVAIFSYLITDQVWVASTEVFFYNTFNWIDGAIARNFFWYLNYVWFTCLCAGGFGADIYAIRVLSEEVQIHAPRPKAPDIVAAQKGVYDLSEEGVRAIEAQIEECDAAIRNARYNARLNNPKWAISEKNGHQWAKIDIAQAAAKIRLEAQAKKNGLQAELAKMRSSTSLSAEKVTDAISNEYKGEVEVYQKRTALASSAALWLGLVAKIALFFLYGARWVNFFADTKKGKRDFTGDGKIDFDDMRHWSSGEGK